MRILSAFLVFFLIAVSGASAAKRVAIVVGNNDYPQLAASSQLQKAVNDARRMEDTLEQLGFTVTRIENATRSEIVNGLFSSLSQLGRDDTVFFFFAGHGVSIDGANYLLPSDINAPAAGTEAQVRANAISEAMILAELRSRGVSLAVVVIDACRDNPFRREGTRGVGDMSRGLRAPQSPPDGLYALYSAGVGQAALDRLGPDDGDPNSVFTRILAPKLLEKGKSLDEIAYSVRNEVQKLAGSVNHQQRPAIYDEVNGGKVYLAGAPDAEPLPPKEPDAGSAPRTDNCADAGRHYDAADKIGTVEAYELHLKAFADCPFASFAKRRIAQLKAAQEPKPEPDTGKPKKPDQEKPGKPQEQNVADGGKEVGDGKQIFLEALQEWNSGGSGLAQVGDKLRQAAEAGYPEAQEVYGTWRYLGNRDIGIEQNIADAIKWKRLAAQNGNAQAHAWLGDQMWLGDAQQSYDERAKHWLAALLLGSDEAQVRLITDRGAEMDTDLLKAIQRFLAQKGLYQGEIDGVIGSGTAAAMQSIFGTGITGGETPQPLRQASGPVTMRDIELGKWPEGIALSGRSGFVALSGQRQLVEFDIDSLQEKRKVKIGRLPVDMVPLNRGGVLALVYTDKKLWRQELNGRGRSIANIPGCPSGIDVLGERVAISYMPDCSSGTSSVLVMDTDSGRQVGNYKGPGGTFVKPVFYGDMLVVTHEKWQFTTIQTINTQNGLVTNDQVDGARAFVQLNVNGNAWIGGAITADPFKGVVMNLSDRSRRLDLDESIQAMTMAEGNIVAAGRLGTIYVISADLVLLKTLPATSQFEPRGITYDGRRLIISGRPPGSDQGGIRVIENWN